MRQWIHRISFKIVPPGSGFTGYPSKLYHQVVDSNLYHQRLEQPSGILYWPPPLYDAEIPPVALHWAAWQHEWLLWQWLETSCSQGVFVGVVPRKHWWVEDLKLKDPCFTRQWKYLNWLITHRKFTTISNGVYCTENDVYFGSLKTWWMYNQASITWGWGISFHPCHLWWYFPTCRCQACDLQLQYTLQRLCHDWWV